MPCVNGGNAPESGWIHLKDGVSLYLWRYVIVYVCDAMSSPKSPPQKWEKAGAKNGRKNEEGAKGNDGFGVGCMARWG